MKKYSIALLLLLWTSVAIAQELSDTEKEILNHVDANHAEALQFLEENVNINSGTMNFEGVRELGEKYREVYDELGFKTSWIPQDEVNRAGHFFAEQKEKPATNRTFGYGI